MNVRLDLKASIALQVITWAPVDADPFLAMPHALAVDSGHRWAVVRHACILVHVPLGACD